MLFLGFDGAVDPAPYLASWRHIASIAFPVATGWAPKVPGTIRAPEPGVVPLGATDISTADGLDPASSVVLCVAAIRVASSCRSSPTSASRVRRPTRSGRG